MAECVRCSAPLPAGARFCPNCGAATPRAPAPQASSAGGATEGVAVVALVLNAFVLPGLGSLIGGRREGWYQLALVLLGMLLGFFFVAALVFGGFGYPALPPFAPLLAFTLLPLAALSAIAAWVWGILTGVQLLRDAQAARVAPGPG